MFKVDWEKTSVTYQLPEGTIEKMVCLAYPDKKLTSSELIAGGCANLNYKIQLKNENQPLILRVYLRDKDAAYREQKLATLIKETVAVPLTHYIGEFEGHHFAIKEFIPGISLRDLLLSDASHDCAAIMHEVGTILSKITAHEFSEAGFFDKELNIIPHSPSDDYLIFTTDCLQNKTLLSVLTSDVITKISQVLAHYGHLFPGGSEKHLVHADFDPANIPMDKSILSKWLKAGFMESNILYQTETGTPQGGEHFVVKIAGSSKFGNNGAILVFNVESCELKAILQDKGFLTTLRTAIAGMIVIQLVPWMPQNIGIIGSGSLAGQLYELDSSEEIY